MTLSDFCAIPRTMAEIENEGLPVIRSTGP
jgi:hypothetical protein